MIKRILTLSVLFLAGCGEFDGAHQAEKTFIFKSSKRNLEASTDEPKVYRFQYAEDWFKIELGHTYKVYFDSRREDSIYDIGEKIK